MKQAVSVEDWQTGGFGLYIHWPFCQSKCPYCDFNSHVSASIDQKRWQDAYLTEIERVGNSTSGRVLQSIFFGGGTPSLMSPELVSAIIDKIRATWPFANDIEITMEANPSSVEAGRFRAYRDAGVNRVSVGVQALNDQDLKQLGRLHSTAEAKSAIKVAQATFPRTSFDLIYARQKQGLEQWRAELTEALELAGGHLSLYQLTIEDNTAFGDRFQRGLLRGLPSEDLGADLYLLTQEMTTAAGFSSYEVSNYALAGEESVHNCIYWNAGDYAGIGPGAHGRLSINGIRYATEAVSNPTKWLTKVEGNAGCEHRIPLSSEDQRIEYLMMGLRRDIGIDMDRLRTITDVPVKIKTIRELQDIGVVSYENNRLFATQRGRLVLNSIIEKLLED